MTLLLVVGLALLNLFISWLNCRYAGRIWDESKLVGGYMRVLVWCAAIQSAVGFSAVIIMGLVFGGYATGELSANQANSVASLWYLLVIFPALGSGLIITVQSLTAAWRERSMHNIGIAAWNTFVMARNVGNATRALPAAFSKVTDLLKNNKNDRKTAMIIFLVLFSIAGGIIITVILIHHYARETKVPIFAPTGMQKSPADRGFYR